jgi:unsaturated chondroitin disaccharide hydrolase
VKKVIENVYKEELKDPKRFRVKELSQDWIDDEIKRISIITKHVIERNKNSPYRFPEECPKEGKYRFRENIGWTEGFWTGINWLLYEATGDTYFKETAVALDQHFVERIQKRIITNHHDLGFLYSLSTVAEYKITGNEKMKDAGIEAADVLLERYWPKAGILQAWGDINDPAQQGRMIMDCSMNIPLLYWASRVTGEFKYQEAAKQHIKKTADYLVREDGSTYHTFYLDVNSGVPIRGTTHQGYSDTSCWARGQAWGIYGAVLSYRYTEEKAYLELSQKLSHYFLNRLPDDHICYWDLIFTQESDHQERDTSSVPIVVCGLLEVLKYLPIKDPQREHYLNAVYAMMASLARDYSIPSDTEEEGFLRHGVYNKPKNNGVDTPNIWGDYFYLEALVRLKQVWSPYW